MFFDNFKLVDTTEKQYISHKTCNMYCLRDNITVNLNYYKVQDILWKVQPRKVSLHYRYACNNTETTLIFSRKQRHIV